MLLHLHGSHVKGYPRKPPFVPKRCPQLSFAYSLKKEIRNEKAR